MADGKIILLVGQRGCGKTTYLRDKAKKAHPDALFVHDVGNNFKDIYNKPFLPINEFKKNLNNVQDALIILEEASIFFKHTNDQDTESILVKSRYNHNTIFFAFHSFRKLPWAILDYVDYLVIFKTKDKLSFVEEKFEDEDLTEVFKRVNASPDKYAFEHYKF